MKGLHYDSSALTLVGPDCFWQLEFLSCCFGSKLWKTDLFIQEPVRMELRLASRCLRLGSLHTTSRWVWHALPPPLKSSVACRTTHIAFIFRQIITTSHNLPFITFYSPLRFLLCGPRSLGHPDLGPWQHFSTSVMLGWVIRHCFSLGKHKKKSEAKAMLEKKWLLCPLTQRLLCKARRE